MKNEDVNLRRCHGQIDRRAVVARHNIELNDAAHKLAIGNGNFCFGADGTGLQTFTGNIMAHWAWHSFPLPEGWTKDQVPSTGTFQKGRNKGEDVFPEGTEEIRQWMFDNPHKINLGRIRLSRKNGKSVAVNDIGGLVRKLDLWTGIQTSSYTIDGRPIAVETCVHTEIDMVAVRVESSLLESGEIEVILDFPYPTFDREPWVGDFSRDAGDDNKTDILQRTDRRIDIRRTVDETVYSTAIMWSDGCRLVDTGSATPAYRLVPKGTRNMEFALAFSSEPLKRDLPSFSDTRKASMARWESFWKSGGAIDLSESKDRRWKELERRIVLSQYHMAAQSAGEWPSAEIGLMAMDGWRSQFHMEMVWWHEAHYALWGRWEMAEKALGCYRRFITKARELAEQLGYKGLQWQKSVGPDCRTAPWIGNQVLLWKQPHPIFFAELEYRLKPAQETLDKWAEIVNGTAEHMADYVTKDPVTGLYSLVPVMPPSEIGISRDTVFDLAYWRWGLDKAQEWRERLGLEREKKWDEVRNNLAPLPVLDGLFVRSPDWHDTYTKWAWEHPDPVGVLGMLPPIRDVSADIAKRTVAKIWEVWDWKRCWGWDFSWIAMAAARTCQPDIAVDALLFDSPKNDYHADGICGGWYLPGNGGLLYAVAMMAAGWDGAECACPDGCAPGFPRDGSWVVRWEGLKTAL